MLICVRARAPTKDCLRWIKYFRLLLIWGARRSMCECFRLVFFASAAAWVSSTRHLFLFPFFLFPSSRASGFHFGLWHIHSWPVSISHVFPTGFSLFGSARPKSAVAFSVPKTISSVITERTVLCDVLCVNKRNIPIFVCPSLCRTQMFALRAQCAKERAFPWSAEYRCSWWLLDISFFVGIDLWAVCSCSPERIGLAVDGFHICCCYLYSYLFIIPLIDIIIGSSCCANRSHSKHTHTGDVAVCTFLSVRLLFGNELLSRTCVDEHTHSVRSELHTRIPENTNMGEMKSRAHTAKGTHAHSTYKYLWWIRERYHLCWCYRHTHSRLLTLISARTQTQSEKMKRRRVNRKKENETFTHGIRFIHSECHERSHRLNAYEIHCTDSINHRWPSVGSSMCHVAPRT